MLIFKKLSLTSLVEKKTYSLNFDRKRNVILGENNTGKTSLIKSMYWAMGGDPSKPHAKWDKANVISRIWITANNFNYMILRYGNQFGIFTDEMSLVASGTGSRF